MRIPIREQLGLLVLLTSLTALAVLSIVTWVNNYNFVVDIRSSRLSLTASLKAAQLASSIVLLRAQVGSISNSIVVQNALLRYNNGNNTEANWVNVRNELMADFAGRGDAALLLQAALFSKNGTGDGGRYALVNVTGENTDEVQLPYMWPNGSSVILGQGDLGHPPDLYPNLTYEVNPINDTYNASVAVAFGTTTLNADAALLLGPLQLNSSAALLSLTVPVINNTSATDILGYLSVIANARTIFAVLNSPEGLGNTGETLLLGPTSPGNLFASNVNTSQTALVKATNTTTVEDLDVKFVLPPASDIPRHAAQLFGESNPAFRMRDYPAVLTAFTQDNGDINNEGSLISTTNEEGTSVSVGYALPQSALFDWVLIVEQDRGEAFAPINKLRNILLACVFGTAGVILILVFPIAHFSVMPIRRLQAATKKTVQPSSCYSDDSSYRSSRSNGGEDSSGSGDDANLAAEPKTSFATRMTTWRRRKRRDRAQRTDAGRQRAFKIPGKVQDRKHIVQDELTDLTQTYNEMSDELMMQYERLEERVKERTKELEMSKKAAEAANESKTLFIANISHELKTPLNGILGMCAVCMGEEDMTKIKRSLGIIYKSGDLLLHLLTDLLTFSKNQIGRNLSLEEKEFRLADISSQILSIFEKQAKDGNIRLRSFFSGPEGGPADKIYLPVGTGRIKDMCLWGDQNRILQVIINLVSNSLKFTPPGQSVELRIKCLGEAETQRDESRKGSMTSKQNSIRPSKLHNRASDSSVIMPRAQSSADEPGKMDTALSINPMDPRYTQIMANDRSPSPPPLHAKTYWFEFEVEDTGPGIPEHLQDRVFEPFVQGDLGLSKKYGGTGLGLSICSQLAKLMRGSITLQSQIGTGSTFTMRIPLKFIKERSESTSSSLNLQSGRNSLSLATLPDDAQGSKAHRSDSTSNVSLQSNHTGHSNPNTVGFDSATKPRLVGLSQPFFAPEPSPESPNEQIAAMEMAAAQASKRGERIRVLVAEDNKVNQEVVLRMLKLEDIYDVTVAKDGQEALDIVKESMEQKRLFNLIFMDIQMPNLDGLQSTKLIRQMGYSAPIVALTAFAEESNVKECMDSGMNFFLAKPIRRPALKEVLKTYCATIPEESEESIDKESPGGKMTNGER
ncbi:MAG: Histidine kinase [Piccolia ochrophora]|nr:MAG: Histidine kinase [Piccolia ochrophora]